MRQDEIEKFLRITGHIYHTKRLESYGKRFFAECGILFEHIYGKRQQMTGCGFGEIINEHYAIYAGIRIMH